MIVRSETKQLLCIGSGIVGSKNDVYICENISANKKELYTLCIIKDHLLAKRLTECFENGTKPEATEIFSDMGMYCIAFPYRQERRLKNFILTERISVTDIKEICRKVVFECMSSKIPWQILYLILKNEYIHIDTEQKIYFTYELNLEYLKNKSETDCAVLCGRYLKELLEQVKCTSWSGYQLLKMKNKRRQYKTFAELYGDISGGAVIYKTGGLSWRVKKFLEKYRGTILKIVKIFCIVIGVIALFVMVSDLIFGENPFLRLFVNTFKQIGTESMLQ